MRDSDFSGTGGGLSGTGKIEFRDGIGFTGAAGYAWGNLRVEGEVSYRGNKLDTATTLGATFGITGDLSALGFMANGWYDVDTGSDWVPYVGGGVGVARVNLQIENVGGVPVSSDDDDTVFAYQIGAGIGRKVSPMTTVNLGYRYFATNDPKLEGATGRTDIEYSSHNIMVGMVVRF